MNETTTAGHTIQRIRCDGDKEFDCDEVRKIVSEKGITLMNSAPYTPEQNGAAERENRTIVELARSMISVSGFSRVLWPEVCETAVYLLNYTGLTNEPNKYPTELWNGRKLTNLNHLRVFGTECVLYTYRKDLERSWTTKVCLEEWWDI